MSSNIRSPTIRAMKSWELETLRRSVAMLPPGHSAGALTKAQAQALLAEIDRSQGDLARFRRAVDELRRVLAALEAEGGPFDEAG